MKMKAWMIVGAAICLAASSAVFAQERTFRTTAALEGVFQIPNPAATTTKVLFTEGFAGHDFVNLALGTALTTVRTNEVLALEINCGSTQASLVIFDRTKLSNIVTLATSTQITALTGQDNPSAPGPNHERFVIQMDVNNNNDLLGGFLTIAGRMYLNPTNGCPRALLVDTDRGSDRLFADAAVKNTDNPAEKDTRISGEAHLIGVADVIFTDGSTNTVLLPFGDLTMRRQLLP
jgi:hypothetical protein